MERFFTYAEQRVKLSPEEKQFIRTHGRIRRYAKKAYYLLAGEHKKTWCFILSGLVAGMHHRGNSRADLAWIAQQYEYFTGTKHTFSDQSEGLDIQPLCSCELLELPLQQVRTVLPQYPQLAELFQILLRKKLMMTRTLFNIQKIAEGALRYVAFRQQLPALERQLTTEETCLFLNISATTYKRGQQLFLQLSK
ncbi:hypothetical protein [Olivibacter oleidegradans]|uniref:CRP-like cAMP-binding protein n=1 Tax=Olivibacter oleidegradans TaxID=760123 RepID=A0ABV6HDF8_9SPHI